MIVQADHNKKPSKKICDRCGENHVTMNFFIGTPYVARNADDHKLPLTEVWKGDRYRGTYTGTMYTCYDCFVELGQEAARNWLHQIHICETKNNKVYNVKELQDLAHLKHERKVYTAKIKETKLREHNSGLDIVGSVL